MASIKKKVNETTERNLNSGILLSIVKRPRLNSDIARQVVEEWSKHVS